jgi:Gpi18-like mannosyltransferase
MLLLYLSIWFFANSSWRVGCFVFSLAVSIKMNILLFAPGLLLLLLQFPPHIGETIVCLGICAAVQLVLGAPFLLSFPESYIRKAFEFDRVFFYKWTVNWKVSHCSKYYGLYGNETFFTVLAEPQTRDSFTVLVGGCLCFQNTIRLAISLALVCPCFGGMAVATIRQDTE